MRASTNLKDTWDKSLGTHGKTFFQVVTTLGNDPEILEPVTTQLHHFHLSYKLKSTSPNKHTFISGAKTTHSVQTDYNDS